MNTKECVKLPLVKVIAESVALAGKGVTVSVAVLVVAVPCAFVKTAL